MRMVGITLNPGMNTAKSTVTTRTAVELHPKWWATPPQTPRIQRSLFARFMPILNLRCPAAEISVLPNRYYLNSTALVKFSKANTPLTKQRTAALAELLLPYLLVAYEPGLADGEPGPYASRFCSSAT